MNESKYHSKEIHIHYTNVRASKTISDKLITYLPAYFSPIIVLCIGTDRSTGDSLGPLTGTLFSKMKPRQLIVYGTLHEPVHAINLDDCLKHIYHTYRQPFIIAIDASLGKSSSVGHLFTNSGSIQPGSALKKTLAPVGDAYLTGVVNVGGLMDYAVLQSTRLSMVHDMAAQLATILFKTDRWLHYYHENRKISYKRLNIQ